MVGVTTYLVTNIGISLVGYIYMAIALQTLAKRTNTPNGWLAWIPILNIVLIANIARMHWWPVLLIIPFIGTQFIQTQSIVILLIVLVTTITILLYFLTFWERIFVRLGRSKWWVILFILPLGGFLAMGVAAWGKDKSVSHQ